MAKQRKKQPEPVRNETPELPEGRPMPWEANPGGVEGVEPDWPGGSSNLGEILNPAFEAPSVYSTDDAEGAPKVDVVARFSCDRCGQAFHTEQLLVVHGRTAHRPRR